MKANFSIRHRAIAANKSGNTLLVRELERVFHPSRETDLAKALGETLSFLDASGGISQDVLSRALYAFRPTPTVAIAICFRQTDQVFEVHIETRDPDIRKICQMCDEVAVSIAGVFNKMGNCVYSVRLSLDEDNDRDTGIRGAALTFGARFREKLDKENYISASIVALVTLMASRIYKDLAGAAEAGFVSMVAVGLYVFVRCCFDSRSSRGKLEWKFEH